MAPPLTLNHLSILSKEFYKNLIFFGRDKLYNLIRDKYGKDKSPSRRQVADRPFPKPLKAQSFAVWRRNIVFTHSKPQNGGSFAASL
jgi:hypothetical protein